MEEHQLLLLWSVLQLQVLTCQSSLQVIFNDNTPNHIPNHSYVDLYEISRGDGIQCRTDKVDCCSKGSANWTDPYGGTINNSGGFRTQYGAQQIELIRVSNVLVSGLYKCVADINGHSSNTQAKGTAYVGLYNSGGDIRVSPLTLTVDSDLNGASPQFTLTCISTGGPATTVTWTRDSEDVLGERVTALNNAVTAQYTHTLTVTGRLGGLYTCTVTNSKPSSDSAQYTVQVASAPTNVQLSQNSPTSILVQWTPPLSVGSTTGYQIHYDGGTSSTSLSRTVPTLGGAQTESFLLRDLTEGGSFIVSVRGLSDHYFSSAIQAPPINLHNEYENETCSCNHCNNSYSNDPTYQSKPNGTNWSDTIHENETCSCNTSYTNDPTHQSKPNSTDTTESNKSGDEVAVIVGTVGTFLLGIIVGTFTEGIVIACVHKKKVWKRKNKSSCRALQKPALDSVDDYQLTNNVSYQYQYPQYSVAREVIDGEREPRVDVTLSGNVAYQESRERFFYYSGV